MKEKDNSKLDIKKYLISEDLDELLKVLVLFFLVGGLCGYVGYIYSTDNNISISHGIIFGILFPLGVGILDSVDLDGFFSFLIYTIVYLIVVSYIPTFVGGIVLLMIIGVFIVNFIYIEKKDRTEEIEKYYKNNKEKVTTAQSNNRTAEDLIREYNATNIGGVIDNTNEDTYTDTYTDSYKETEEEFECEMCFKKVSEEEYELYDCMCEECFIDVHTDKDGKFHDDEFFDV